LIRRIEFGPRAIVLVTIVLVCVVSLLYLAEFNEIATEGVIIDSLKSQRDRLIIENEVWNMRISDVKSLDVIQSTGKVRGMVFVDEFLYIKDEPAGEE